MSFYLYYELYLLSSEVRMQLIVRSSSTHVIDVSPEANVEVSTHVIDLSSEANVEVTSHNIELKTAVKKEIRVKS